ncbi:MAG: TetR/AcrR family transcriptional regulator [Streptosporangiaceae bacterium]
MARSKDPSQGVRPRILAAGLHLFAEKGFDGTSVQEIVARAGVTKGALYHYFSAKEDILFEIYGTIFARELERLAEIRAERGDPRWTLRTIIEDLVVNTAATAKESSLFSKVVIDPESPRWQRAQERWREYQEGVREVIRDGQRAGIFSPRPSPEIASWWIFGFTNSLHTWFRPDGPRSSQDIGRELADLVLAGLEI